MDETEPRDARRQVLRRVRYATNTLALLETKLPPEGPFDDALTNALVSIVATEWPGEETNDDGFHRSARQLLRIIEAKHDPALAFVPIESLRDALDLTQPFRHGRADDEFATINRTHIAALRVLDRHHSLNILEKVTGRSVDDALVIAYTEHAEMHLPFDPKDRLNTPDPDECPECWRPTFLPEYWDDFGGTNSEGVCIACGYERSREDASQDAITAEMRRRMEEAALGPADTGAAALSRNKQPRPKGAS